MVQDLIRQVGLAPTKARNICSMSKVSLSFGNVFNMLGTIDSIVWLGTAI